MAWARRVSPAEKARSAMPSPMTARAAAHVATPERSSAVRLKPSFVVSPKDPHEALERVFAAIVSFVATRCVRHGLLPRQCAV